MGSCAVFAHLAPRTKMRPAVAPAPGRLVTAAEPRIFAWFSASVLALELVRPRGVPKGMFFNHLAGRCGDLVPLKRKGNFERRPHLFFRLRRTLAATRVARVGQAAARASPRWPEMAQDDSQHRVTKLLFSKTSSGEAQKVTNGPLSSTRPLPRQPRHRKKPRPLRGIGGLARAKACERSGQRRSYSNHDSTAPSPHCSAEMPRCVGLPNTAPLWLRND